MSRPKSTATKSRSANHNGHSKLVLSAAGMQEEVFHWYKAEKKRKEVEEGRQYPMRLVLRDAMLAVERERHKP